MTPTRPSRPVRHAFTLVEILFAILIIGVLLGLLIVGLRQATKAGKSTVDRQGVIGMKVAVQRFRDEFGFLPPLVRENHPQATRRARTETVAGEDRIAVYTPSLAGDRNALLARGPGNSTANGDYRFSVHSLPYYLLGGLEVEIDAAWPIPIDGVSGPGFLEPGADGTFKVPAGLKAANPTNTRTGRRFDPFFDAGRSSAKVFTSPADPAVVELRDRNGQAFRYYRWLHGNPAKVAQFPPDGIENLGDLNVPAILGDPSTDLPLRDAAFAIVAAGPNGVFGDETDVDELRRVLGLAGDASVAKVRAEASADNIVEVGK